MSKEKKKKEKNALIGHQRSRTRVRFFERTRRGVLWSYNGATGGYVHAGSRISHTEDAFQRTTLHVEFVASKNFITHSLRALEKKELFPRLLVAGAWAVGCACGV
jgi:hypothetical protein